jgi:DNA-binding transcriptional MocR family regulator
MGMKGITLYVALAQYADNKTGKCWPSLRTIQKETGMSRPTIIEAKKLLESLGILRTENRHRQSTVYILGGKESTHFAKEVVKNMHSGGKEYAQGGKASLPQLDSLTILKELNEDVYDKKLQRNKLGLPVFS